MLNLRNYVSLIHNLHRRSQHTSHLSVRSDSDNGSYIPAVISILQDYKKFLNFKRSPRYQDILEHVSESLGYEYFKMIRQQEGLFDDELSELMINDLVGNPIKFEYSGLKLSPTTLRYGKVSSDLRNLFGNLKDFNIAEIGVGYGGQALILDRIFEISNYTLIDLEPVLELSAKYLDHHILNLLHYTPLQLCLETIRSY